MSLQPYRVPRTRSPTQKLNPVGFCIYCRASAKEVDLTDEHIIPDGLGGDLVLPAASCKACATATSRAELHLLREAIQFPRGVAGLRSRKRKSAPPTADVTLDGELAAKAKPLDEAAPFMFAIFTTDLPGILRGAAPDETQGKFPVALFGPKDWVERAGKWLGGNGTFRWGNRIHPGIVGQAFAKIAHSYACATLGPDAFQPFLIDYIQAHEPSFDEHHIGVHDSGSFDECLHYVDLQVAYVPHQTVIGRVLAPVYVVFLRLFAFQPAPSVLVVVGRPSGSVDSSLKVMQLQVPPMVAIAVPHG